LRIQKTTSLFARAAEWPERLALVGPDATATYGQLLDGSARTATALLDGRVDLAEDRVVFLLPPGIGHVRVQWAIWRAGGLAVPLSASQAPAEWTTSSPTRAQRSSWRTDLRRG
jgi:malonyl-CoA/methylmalonyl-CoA synthetase